MNRILRIACIFLLPLVCFVPKLYAQRLKSMNLATFNQKKYHFGFTLGLNNSNFTITRFPQSTFPKDSLSSIESSSRYAFNLGIIASYRLSRNLAARIIPALYFSDKDLIYTFTYSLDSAVSYTKNINSTYLNIPLLFKYRSHRLNNLAAYIIGGASYSLNFSSNSGVDNLSIDYNEIILKLVNHEINIEGGLGIDFYLPYFKLGLELKMVYSVLNNRIDDDTPFSRSIESLRNRMVVFSILFEGGRKY